MAGDGSVEAWNEVREAARPASRDFLERRFRFLGREVSFAGEIDWTAPGESQLWRYHLHYFDHARPLLVASPAGTVPAIYDAFRALVRSWIAGNRALRGDGWHPYTLSLRLVNWLQFAHAWRDRLAGDSPFAREFHDSLFAQARLLYRQREYDVRGNHLWENLRALLWAGLSFDGDEARRWRERALADLQSETAEQILPDGGHFERTPGYHVVVLRDSLEMAVLLERNGGGCPEWLRLAVKRQAEYLRRMLGATSQVPLFKDTAFDAFPDPREMLHLAAAWLDDPGLKPAATAGHETLRWFGVARWTQVAAWPVGRAVRGAVRLAASGYCVMSADTGERLTVDVGRPCPDYLPAHGHADTLSFEWLARGQSVAVDAGVGEYQAGPWREHFRSTRAHNTVEIAGQNSSEVWSSFRVGRRARPTVHFWRGTEEEAALLASHDGYAWLAGAPIHTRLVLWRRDEYLVVIDRVEGQAPHAIVNRVHLHPDRTVEADGLGRWKIGLPGASIWLHEIGLSGEPGRAEVAPDGWYSERFGEKRPAMVVRWSATPAKRHVGGYAFSSRRDFNALGRMDGSRLHLEFSAGAGRRRYVVTEQTVEECS